MLVRCVTKLLDQLSPCVRALLKSGLACPTLHVECVYIYITAKFNKLA